MLLVNRNNPVERRKIKMDNYLQHYGVLGMRWGVRRTPAQLGRSSNGSTKRKRFSIGVKKSVPKQDIQSIKPKQKTIKDLTDDELRQKINRLRMEQEYRNLSPAQISTGKKVVDRILKNVVTPAAEDVAKQLTKSMMTKAVNKAFNLDDELKVYTNNKKKN